MGVILDARDRRARARRPTAGRRWPLEGAGPETTVASRSVGDFLIMELGGRPTVRCVAQNRNAQSARGRLLLGVLVAGDCAFRSADGRLRDMRRNEVLLADCGQPLELRGDDAARVIALVAPTHLVSPRFVSFERLKAATLQSHGRGVAALLYQFLAGLGEPQRATPGAGALVDALGGLLSAALEDCLPAPRVGAGESGQVRLEHISRHLRRHFADPGLSAAEVAEAVGVSRRYLHKLYAQAGRSFRDELIQLRIDACVRAFLDEQQTERTIAEIAFAAGYTDISQFNRHFRRLKGATPSALRRAALAELAAAERKSSRRSRAA
jgi:AraC-like DNA-binding protein